MQMSSGRSIAMHRRRLKATALVSVAALLASTVAFVGGGSAFAQTGVATLHVVVQSAPAVAVYGGGIAGLAPTNPEALGALKLDSDSPASIAYVEHLNRQRAELLARMSAALGHAVNTQDDYVYALNGFSALLTRQEAQTVSSMPGVAFVRANENLHTLTDAGPAWMHADELWDGTAIAGVGTRGERIVAGIIDTGVNPGHPSFAEVGPVDGYVHTNPRVRFYGECAATPPPAPGALCNNKLIGLYDFTGVGVADDVGHGSHTASTVAGNVVDATLYAPTTTLGPTRISGVAPHANIISYKACMAPALVVPGANVNLGSCPLNALVAAIDAATADAVDVVNFSIGGGTTDPWQDPLGLSFFGAHAAGVFVAASAGNSGPGPQTIGRPSNSPWLMSVGASTHDRRPTGRVVATKANGASLEFTGMSLTSGLGPLAIVDALALGNNLCDAFTAAQAAQLAGRIVVCHQGTIGRVQKGINVKAAGGVGMILIGQAGTGNSVLSDTHVIPTVMIGDNDGTALRAWLAGASSPQATLHGTQIEVDTDLADRMAGFSSRGPDLSSPDVIKPDLTAPGVAIWAAWMEDGGPTDDYQMIQGTSMSSPHAAGAGALMRALHLDWTPDQIKSALMSTAFTVPDGGNETVPVTKEDHATLADPFDRGGGRIDLARAARAGFTVSESVAGYQAANPALGGEAFGLNIASLANSDCRVTCTWTRTLVSTSDRPITYTVSATDGAGFDLSVSPSTFTLQPLQGPTVAPGLGDPSLPGTQTITITATDTGLVPGRWQFGEIRFTADSAALPAQHFPVAVRTAGGAPAPDCEIPATVVASAPAATNVPAYNDILEVTAAGLYPTFAGDALPNVRFGVKVTQLGLAGALPPNQHWRVAFVPPGAPAGTSYFVQMVTNTTGQASFVYGTLAGGSFTTLGAPDAGTYSLADSTISITIAASKILNPGQGSTLSSIIAASGAPQPGTLTTNLKTLPAGQYTLTSCGADPTPTPSPTPSPTPTGGSGEVTLYFQGNLDDGCIGDGNADFYTCGGPWLRADSTLDASSPPAHWETTSATDDDTDRSLIDPNWIWELSEPTTIGGPMTVEWWGNCNVCAGDAIDASEWNIRIYADGAKKFERLRVQVPVQTPGIPERLTTTVNLPNITANESIVLHVDPYWPDQQNPNLILYDSELGCGPDGLSPCDSLVRVSVGGVTPTPTPTSSPTPTPTPLGCTPDNVWFLAVVNDGNQPGEPRLDFQADMDNFEFFLSTLRESYCIPDAQASILAFTDGWTNPDTGQPMSPYPEASEANVKAKLAEFGAASSAHSDSLFFFFLSSHGIQYTAAGWTGGASECPVERVAGSLSGLKAGDGESGDFFDCELGTALNTKFAPSTRMFVAVDCSFCGGFSDSLTAASGTIPDDSLPASSGVPGPNRIAMTGCAMTTECFGSSVAENGAVSYHHMREVLEGTVSCDGWTAPGFPGVQGFDVPVNGDPFTTLDGTCTASEWFFAAVWSAYTSADVIGIQQQFRIKYGLPSIEDDLVIVGPDTDPELTPPDLQVIGMEAANQSPREGDRVVVSTTIANRGERDAGASTTELRLEDGTLVGTAPTAAIAAGSQVTVQVAWDTHRVKGEQVVVATADAAAAVAESRETNNLGRYTTTVKGNKVQNGSFEQPADSGGSAPEGWSGGTTGAGSTGYGSTGAASDGSHAVTISGTGKSCAVYGQPTWTSAPIAVTAGEVLTLTADVQGTGLSSAPSLGLVYLGPAGALLGKVTLLTAPLTTSGFAALEKTFTVPAGVASVRIVLTGFSPTDLRTAGTVTFDDVGLFGE